jgi:bis(5'-nucleosyl)-tetraphosphatase (symmetrical)
VAVYAIGDVQGCYVELRRLLDLIRFDPGTDRLWLTGDLVNRGPRSVDVLRLVRSLGEAAIAVLGNHDLTVLAAQYGHIPYRRQDSYADILGAPDRDELLHWLRWRPVAYHDPSLGYLMVHAGVPPQWDLEQIECCARELEATLRSEGFRPFMDVMYGDAPRRWDSGLQGVERLRFITNCFTRIRYCDADGRLNLTDKGPPGTQTEGSLPWFRIPYRKSLDLRFVVGHWAALGVHREAGVQALDSGCAWGRRLTAMRLDMGDELVSVSCEDCRR